MRQTAFVCLLIVGSLVMVAGGWPSPKTDKVPPNQSTATIEGLIRDIACPIQNLDAKATDFNLKCALDCARKGSPLVIQTQSGELFIPISDSMPDSDQRAQLMPFVGKYVRASGTIYERKGTRAIVISSMEEMEDVHLNTEAQ